MRLAGRFCHLKTTRPGHPGYPCALDIPAIPGIPIPGAGTWRNGYLIQIPGIPGIPVVPVVPAVPRYPLTWVSKTTPRA